MDAIVLTPGIEPIHPESRFCATQIRTAGDGEERFSDDEGGE